MTGPLLPIIVDPAVVAPPSAGRPEDAALHRLYADLDAAIAAHSPRCDASGRCCRFAEYGHTLFLSEWEADVLTAAGLKPPAVGEEAAYGRDGCPYQVDGLCTARDRRPLGCRVYFCDPAFAERQVEIAEAFVARLKELHDAVGRPWRYAPLQVHLRDAVQRLGSGRDAALESP
ncbi:MAG: hypothetical protein ACRC1K_04750 [Planctomycetia bacterium]